MLELTCIYDRITITYPTFKWYKDGIPITDDFNVATKTSTFKMQHLRLSDSGTYNCKASKWYGFSFSSPSVVLEVIEPKVPVINKGTMRMGVNLERFVNDSLELTCIVDGMPTPNITWYKNDVIQTGNSNAVLMLNNFVLRIQYLSQLDKGVYKCEAHNQFGIDSFTWDLKIIEPKVNSRLVTQADIRYDIEHFVGDSLDLNCSINGLPKPETIWYKDGLQIRTNYGVHLVANDSILRIPSVTLSDEGIYKCEHQFTNDSVTWNFKTIDRKAEFVNQTNMRDKLELSVGEPLEITCKVIEGLPKPNITWFKDEVQITANPYVLFLGDNSILRIQAVTISDGGIYKCMAHSRFGTKFMVSQVKVTRARRLRKLESFQTSDFQILWVISIGVLIILIVCFVTTIFKMYTNFQKKKKNKSVVNNFENGDIEKLNPNLSIVNHAYSVPAHKKCYELPPNRLKLGKELGSGAFGVVFQGVAENIIPNEKETVVAVKMIKGIADDETIRALVLELKLLTHIGKHLNIVNLLGAITKDIAKSEIKIIVEYCHYGCVRNILIRNRKWFLNQIDPKTDKIDSTALNYLNLEMDISIDNKDSDSTKPIKVNTSDLLSWAFQVARGMDYLSYKKVVHGDLAARNILLCKDNVVKICDFGLARSIYENGIYVRRFERPLPIKWLALESLTDNVFNVRTDVWSYGIMLWEFFSLAAEPYHEMDVDNDFILKLIDGFRMEKPHYANQELYEIMLECWRVSPERRPLFHELEKKFAKILGDKMANYFVKLNEPYLKMNAVCMPNGETENSEALLYFEQKLVPTETDGQLSSPYSYLPITSTKPKDRNHLQQKDLYVSSFNRPINKIYH